MPTLCQVLNKIKLSNNIISLHCNHNLLSSNTMVAMNSILGISKPLNFGKPMDCSHHFHRECYAGFRPTCAYILRSNRVFSLRRRMRALLIV